MRLFIDDELIEATPAQHKDVLALEIFKQPVSLWQACDSVNGFYFKRDVPFRYLVKHIVEPELLNADILSLVNKIIAGEAEKSELFGFCVATFSPDGDGRIRRSKTDYKTFTKLLQLDLDLKNEPNCTEEYVEEVINDIFEVTDLGKHILMCGKSISRKGLYLFLEADTDDLEVLQVVINKSYALLNKIFKFKNPTKTLDTSIIDIVSRLRYFSPDPDLVINPNVQPLNTSGIKVKSKIYNNPSPIIGNAFRELEIIRSAENRLLKNYSPTSYQSGFHTDFLRFASSCFSRGVTKKVLEDYTQKKYGQLFKPEDRLNYLSELLRSIDCAEKYFQKNKTY